MDNDPDYVSAVTHLAIHYAYASGVLNVKGTWGNCQVDSMANTMLRANNSDYASTLTHWRVISNRIKLVIS